MASRIATQAIPYTEFSVADGNFDKTRTTIDRVVIHTMVGTVQSAANRFNTVGQQVSAHYGIGLDGKLYHWLEEYWTAYHAGNYAMNQRSIGIEHEDNGDYNGPRSDALYTTSAKLVRDICQFYNIPIDRDHIRKHNEVSDKPTGCPDALDIDRIVREAANATPSQPMATITQKDLDQLRSDRDTNYNNYQSEIAKNTTLESQLHDMSGQLVACQSDLSTCRISQGVPPILPLPSNPEYKPFLIGIKEIAYGKGWPWTKLSKVKGILTQANI